MKRIFIAKWEVLIGKISCKEKMKKSKLTLTIFLSFIISSYMANGQVEKSFNTLEFKTVMNRLFDSVLYNERNEARWKPNYAESLVMPISDDNYCYTLMDTIMYYSGWRSDKALIIFTTYEYDGGERLMCHACAPTIGIAIFSKELAGKWQIQTFLKNFEEIGSWGERCELSMEKLGKDLYCLVFDYSYGNQGSFSSTRSYYALYDYGIPHEIFSYDYSLSNEGFEEGKGYSEEIKMKIIPTDSYYLIELISKRNNSNSVIKSTYKYSEDLRSYMSVQTSNIDH